MTATTNITTASWMSRMVVPSMALAAAGGVALVFAIQYIHREPRVETRAATAAPAASQPASGARDQDPAALAKAQTEAAAVANALAGSPPQADSEGGVPSFDVARIEPSGEAVIAGRAAPGATVELLRNGEVQDHAVADQSGQFVMVPPRLPPGTYDLTLRAKQPDGKQTTSKQSVAVALEPGPESERPAGRGADDAGQTHHRAVAAGGAKAAGRGSGCGDGRGRTRRQAPCDGARAPRRHGAGFISTTVLLRR